MTTPNTQKNFWLLKTEPSCWSWTQQVSEKTAEWDDVRNFQAQKHMRAMQVGDEAFFYHTGTERRIMGTVRVTRAAYPDPAEPRFCLIDVTTVSPFQTPVTLARIKEDPRLQNLPLVRQGRLSVMPMTPEAWDLITQWGAEKR